MTRAMSQALFYQGLFPYSTSTELSQPQVGGVNYYYHHIL